jgi:hypothetical protein
MLRLALALTAGLSSATAAAAQQPACTARSDVVSQLSSRYSERPVAMGLANNGGVIEIFSSQAGQSWTIVLTMPSGLSCLIAAGENWESLPALVKAGPPA